MIRLWMVLLLVAVNSLQAEFRAGIAVRIVTPDPLLPVSGGVGPSNPAREKRGELTVRALVLERDDTRVALVNADFLGFPRWLGDQVRAAVRGIPPENILIGVTHTHSAPDCYGFPDQTGKSTADHAYLEQVCARLAEAIQAASESCRPATVRIATGEAKGKIAYNYYAPLLYDPRCHVLQVLDDAGQPFATLINYAIHPEVLGANKGILSPDLCGPLYDRVAARGGGTAIFFNSAQGGMVTADVRRPDGGENNTWEECVRIGELLADEALRIVSEAPVQRDPALRCVAREIRLPVTSPLMRQLVQLLTSQLPGAERYLEPDAVRTQLNLVAVGDALMVTIPGEAMPNIGYYLKRKLGTDHAFLLGLTNDAYGYLLSKVDFDSFRRYDYISRTSLGEMAGEVFMEEALRLAQDHQP